MKKRVEKLRQEVKAETQKGLEAVTEDGEKKQQKIILEMKQKAEEKTEELGNRIGKHVGETEEQFKTTEEKIAKTDKEVAQVKEDFGKLSLETIGEGLNKLVEKKMEEVERRLEKRVETRGERQDVLLRERGGGEYAPPRRIVPRWSRCHRAE